MNVTELARQLKITTEELFEKLPKLGFDIGRRAIKVDDRIADKIIKAWRSDEKKRHQAEEIAKIRGEAGEESGVQEEAEAKEIKIPPTITVRELAGLMDFPINQLLKELMKNGVLASMNEEIDFETASIVSQELGFKPTAVESVELEEQASLAAREKLQKIISDSQEKLQPRPPVVVVMGHVDHGKTKILDAIRETNVTAGESGGITQHIGAYQIEKNGRLITFIDTPGHEAFTAMRSRGARVADIAILVVAADDGVQPQTKEAIKIIQDAKLPFLVAINKIDRPEADPEKIKQELSALNLAPEDWGGETICVLVSAKEKTGIDGLLETVVLLADLEKERLKADPDRLAIGTIIESHVDKGEGPVATILIQAGTLKTGEQLALGNLYLGRARSLKDFRGRETTQAVPGTPAKILGLKIAPEVGSILEVPENPKSLTKDLKKQKIKQEKDFSVQQPAAGSPDQESINLIVKADVLGSLEAIIESLAKLEMPEVKVKIISKGLGIITEADVLKAEATGAEIIGFHVKPTAPVANFARDKGVTVSCYQVIYHLVEEIEKKIAEKKKKEVVTKILGKLEVLKVFRQETKKMIVGGRVIEGTIKSSETVIIERNGQAVSSGKVERLESAKQAVDSVSAGQECGVSFQGEPVIQEGDILEFYQTKEK